MFKKKKKTPKTHPAGLPSCQGQDCRREPGSRGDTRFLPTLGAERDPPGKGLCLQEPIMKLGSGTLKHTRPRDAMRAAAALSHRNPGTGEPGPQTSLEGAGGGQELQPPPHAPASADAKEKGLHSRHHWHRLLPLRRCRRMLRLPGEIPGSGHGAGRHAVQRGTALGERCPSQSLHALHKY